MSGIYIHVPFCRKKCSYCDFHFSTNFESYRSKMIDKIAEEIKWRANESIHNIETIYFGGGTPSILNSTEFDVLFNSLRSSFDLKDLKEITIEVNPEDINTYNLETWKKHEINRISLGVQSLSNKQLSWMNRAHDSETTTKALESCFNNGFSNVSVDFIYGLPQMTSKEFKEALFALLDFPIKHISAYILTVENGTKLSNQVKKGLVNMPIDEKIQKQYYLLCSLLSDKGFNHYEISNFSKPGYQSIHNGSYWRGVPYIGVGPSAHSYSLSSRRWNIANNYKYLAAEKNSSLWFETEFLTPVDLWNECILTGLRTDQGINKKTIEKLGGFTKKESQDIHELLKQSILIESEYNYALSEKSWLIAEKISMNFFRINE